MKKINTVIWFVVFVTVMVVGYFWLGAHYQNVGDVVEGKESSAIVRTNAAIGGPFQLINHEGQPFGSENLKGKWQIIYFGYTFCPDICPMELQTITTSLQLLTPEQLENVQPVFISLDPERDNPKHLKNYISLFHPKLIGLTGTVDQIKATAKSYKLFFQKVNDPNSSSYLMDHSTYTYLIDPEGNLHSILRYPLRSDILTRELRNVLKRELS